MIKSSGLNTLQCRPGYCWDLEQCDVIKVLCLACSLHLCRSQHTQRRRWESCASTWVHACKCGMLCEQNTFVKYLQEIRCHQEQCSDTAEAATKSVRHSSIMIMKPTDSPPLPLGVLLVQGCATNSLRSHCRLCSCVLLGFGRSKHF
jgi:hypothetical protein